MPNHPPEHPDQINTSTPVQMQNIPSTGRGDGGVYKTLWLIFKMLRSLTRCTTDLDHLDIKPELWISATRKHSWVGIVIGLRRLKDIELTRYWFPPSINFLSYNYYQYFLDIPQGVGNVINDSFLAMKAQPIEITNLIERFHPNHCFQCPVSGSPEAAFGPASLVLSPIPTHTLGHLPCV